MRFYCRGALGFVLWKLLTLLSKDPCSLFVSIIGRANAEIPGFQSIFLLSHVQRTERPCSSLFLQFRFHDCFFHLFFGEVRGYVCAVALLRSQVRHRGPSRCTRCHLVAVTAPGHAVCRAVVNRDHLLSLTYNAKEGHDQHKRVSLLANL